MKVALIQAPFLDRTSPPTSLALLSGCLKAAGHAVEFFDFNNRLCHDAPPAWRDVWRPGRFAWTDPLFLRRLERDTEPVWRGYLAALKDCGADVYGFSVQSSARHFSLLAARRLRRLRPSAKIVFGGPDCFPEYDEAFYREQSFIDAVVTGEGETAFPDLLARWADGRSLDGCPGVAARGLRGAVLPPAPTALDGLPFMDYAGFRLEEYGDPAEITLYNSRGCVRRCVFCLDWKMGAPYRTMSGDRIHAEMRRQLERHPGLRRAWFNDSLINGDVRALDRLLDLLLDPATALPRPVEWGGMAILHPMLDDARLARMRRAGCVQLNFGFESASPDVVARMHKGFRVDAAERVVDACARAGIRVSLFLIVGFPGETEADFEKTLAFTERRAGALAEVALNVFVVPEAAVVGRERVAHGIAPAGAHGLFWRTTDGANTFSVRMRRYRRLAEALEARGVRVIRRELLEAEMAGWRLSAAQTDCLPAAG